MEEKKIGIIGFGNMGQAIAERLKTHYQVVVFDKDKAKTRNSSGIEVAKDIVTMAKEADTLIFAVKPQDFNSVLNEVKDIVSGKLIISIAAGITTAYIEKILGKVKIVRVMPNICAKIGKAESILSKGKYAQDKDLYFAQELFNYLGKTWIMQEERIDAVTAITGSGPAYIYYDMEIKKHDPKNLPELVEKYYVVRLTEAAKRVGFNPEIASELATCTTASSLSLSASSDIPPSELRKQITSQGGTTEAAIKVLMEGGSWEKAAEAALKRAKELSKR